jgi:hypothetical protein
MKKLSIIRGKDVVSCPYGLPIIEACCNIGDNILKMQVLNEMPDDKIKQAINNNHIIYMTQQIGERCVFANEIMKKYNKVDCSYGDSAAGEGVSYLNPSPFAPSIYISQRPDMPNTQQNITDPRLFFDEPGRGIDVPFGLFSVFADKYNQQELIKLANAKTTNNLPNIVDKIGTLKGKYFDILKLVVNAKPIKLSVAELEKMLVIINDWT